jgi:hypothetical protein
MKCRTCESLVLCLCASAASAAEQPTTRPAAVEIRGDVRVRGRAEWRNTHYQIHGNVFFEEGGELVLDGCTIELMNSYTRQYEFRWRGGRLESRNTTVGGTKKAGSVYVSNFELDRGEWIATDTTVRYTAGIVFGDGRLDATRLIQGPNPDSVILCGKGRCVIRDSTYCVSLFAFADKGGKGIFDLPVDQPISRVFDASNVPGAPYRLELVNTKVPVWFLFANQITMDGPPTEIEIRHCPVLIGSILGQDLSGPMSLPCPWPGKAGAGATLKTGNVTWKAAGEDVNIFTWGAYLWGDKTDVVFPAPTNICELMVYEGKASLVGTPGAYDAVTPATTIEVGRPGAADSKAELVLRNVAIGHPGRAGAIRGQITAHGSSRVSIEHARCNDLLLITKNKGTITVSDIEKVGQVDFIQDGGSITLPNPTTRPE